MITLAFDVYGTLIDTNGVVLLLNKFIGDRVKEFSQRWREKQLEYSFRKGLMQRYETFAVCTSQALDYTCQYYNTPLTQEQKNRLLLCYKKLPAFNDVKDSLTQLKTANFRLYAFSNGNEAAIEELLVTAGIRDLFLGVVSVDDIKTFKPNPSVYCHFLTTTESSASNTWLISSNPFDVIGAISSGMRAAWIKRSENVIFDPWGIEPTVTIEDFNQLYTKLKSEIYE